MAAVIPLSKETKAAIIEEWVGNGCRSLNDIAREFNVSPGLASRTIDLWMIRKPANPVVLVKPSKV